MSAFAVIYERSNTPGDPSVFDRVMEQLSHRGPDGSDIVSLSNLKMGHWHFWTTPQEVGERQPLALANMPFKIVFDGRIDNREELFLKLNIAAVEGRSLSDAALILRAYAYWSADCLIQLLGEFAFVIFDEQRNEIICARDPMGDRTLFFAFYGQQVVIASESWAVASASKPEVEEVAAAHYFAMRATEDGKTLFRDVYELLPAHGMTINLMNQRIWRYWQPDPFKRIRYKEDEDYAVQFHAILEESVRCRMRSNTSVGVLMSGGLDSPSIACLAAQMIAPTPLTTISHVFDDQELKECDERDYIKTMIEEWGIRSIQIPCDDAWPLKDFSALPVNKSHPEINGYRWLKERAYLKAKSEGLRVLLTGEFGDHLYAAGVDWLADLLSEGNFREAIQEVNNAMRYAGWRRNWRAGYLQRSARHMLDILPWSNLLHRKQTPPEWLTQYSLDRLGNTKTSALAPALERHSALLGLWASKICSTEMYHASRHSLELRHPYRDRRLVEFVLALPAYQLHSSGVNKHVLRNAMNGLLPEKIRSRRQPTSLTPFFFRGMKREKNAIQTLLQDPQAKWRTYVKSDWILKRWADLTANQRGPEVIMPWLFASYEIWHKSSMLS